jgi:hypothetical protein
MQPTTHMHNRGFQPQSAYAAHSNVDVEVQGNDHSGSELYLRASRAGPPNANDPTSRDAQWPILTEQVGDLPFCAWQSTKKFAAVEPELMRLLSMLPAARWHARWQGQPRPGYHTTQQVSSKCQLQLESVVVVAYTAH